MDRPAPGVPGRFDPLANEFVGRCARYVKSESDRLDYGFSTAAAGVVTVMVLECVKEELTRQAGSEQELLAKLDEAYAKLLAIIELCQEELDTGNANGSAMTLARRVLALCGEERRRG